MNERTMLKVITGIFFVCPLSIGQHFGDEAIYTINGKKALHHVSEKFLSISIDPAVLLTGLNLSEISSDTSLQLAKHLSPAYIRIAGPSTQFVKYEDFPSSEQENVVVTSAMWFGINEWLHSANLTPVFGINDGETKNGEWNPQTTMPLLDISDKFNLSCYWQLGYDCSNKTEEQYKNDLKRFHHVLEAFPDQKDSWKIVGSDLSRCISNNFTETSRRVLEDLEGDIAAIVWEPKTQSESCFLEEHLPERLLSFPIKPGVSIWTASPKTPHPASFSSALSWAEQLGQAAKIGYEVIFRQPRLREIFSESPPFWVSLLHKALMGRTVLEVKTATGHNPPVSVYAHCTRHQNNFIRSGAMTVFTVNNSTKNHTIFLRLGVVSLSNMEVQSYVLTAPNDDATDVYLNEEKLNLGNFNGDKMNILPKLRRARVMNYLSLSLPPKSIGFFVLPAARVPICINEESDMESIMEEIYEDQKIPFSQEVSIEVTPRFFTKKQPPTLRELRNQMERELESDEKYYQQMKHQERSWKPEDTGRKSFFAEKLTQKPDHLKDNERRNLLNERPTFFTERPTHHSEMSERRTYFNDRLKQRHEKHHEEEESAAKKVFELELTSAEIKKVLADRARAKAAKKNIIFTSEELDEIMNKATEKFLKNKNTSIRVRKKEKRETGRDKKDINMRLLKLKSLGEKRRLLLKQLTHRPQIHKKTDEKRAKRDINMDLLKIKAELMQNKHKKSAKSTFHNKEEKEATVREAGDTSADFADYTEDKEESPLPDQDIFAQIAEADDIFTTTEKSRIANLKILKPGFFNIHKPAVVPKFDLKIPSQKPTYAPQVEKTDVMDFEEEDDDNDSIDDQNDKYDACIHEFSLNNVDKIDQTKKVSELWEAEAGITESVEEKKQNHLPSLANRALIGEEGEDSTNSKFREYFDEKFDSMGLNDYEDLESDESNPVRLKREVLDETLIKQQYKMLKERLANRKILKLINKRKTRAIGERTGSFDRRYKSLSDGIKIWKPSDILTLKNSHSMEKSKRSVDTNKLNSVENEIDNFMNEIEKDSKLMEPKLDMENGDYQLVFPNKDKIEVVENLGDTELKLLIHGSKDEKFSTSTAKSVESNIQKISKEYDNNVWEKLFRKVTKFFQRLSVKLKNYVLEDLLK